MRIKTHLNNALNQLTALSEQEHELVFTEAPADYFSKNCILILFVELTLQLHFFKYIYKSFIHESLTGFVALF